MSQFSNTMTAQTDLRVEAAHLRRCYNNFRRIRQNTTPPFPVPGYETAAVLVETFEPGTQLNPGPESWPVCPLAGQGQAAHRVTQRL